MIVLLLHKLRGGGVQRSLLHLAAEFDRRGHRVELVACHDAGPARHPVPDSITVVHLAKATALAGRRAALRADRAGWRALVRPVLLPLATSWHVAYLPALVSYLRRERPAILLTAGPYMNLIALWARRLAGVATRIVASERVAYSHFLEPGKRHRWRWRYLAPLVARGYRDADAIVAVSEGVADELSAHTGIERARISVIYNPVVTPRIHTRASEPPAHPWFAPGRDTPVILGAGRLVRMKDFITLIHAFAAVRRKRRTRLVILGEGRRRGELERLVHSLGLDADVELPGWCGNPYACMANADLFVLSSRGEGLPNALLEAMACGCPVVSTDCPSGPREILENGRYGELVPVGDSAAMAAAIERTLDAPADRADLQTRAGAFSLARSADAHLALFERLRSEERACSDGGGRRAAG